VPTFHGDLAQRLIVGWLYAFPLVALGSAILLLASKRGARVLPWAPVVTSVAGLAWALGHPASVSVQHVGTLLRVGQLDVRCDLVLDRASAVLALLAAVVVAVGARKHDARGAAGLVALGAAASFAILSDDLLVAGLAWALVALGAGAEVARDRLADAALVASGAVLFWGLGGAFTGAGYAPSLEPRVVAVLSGEETAKVARSLFDDDDDEEGLPPVPTGGKGSLTLTALPGAELFVDESRVPFGGAAHPLRSPFTEVPLTSGYHSFRVHAGQAQDDFTVPQVRVEPGQRVTLLAVGPTSSALDVADQLELREETRRPRAEALAERTLFGAPLAWLSGALLGLALLWRRGRGPLGALVALCGVAVFARHVQLPLGLGLLVGLGLAAASALIAKLRLHRVGTHAGAFVQLVADGIAELDWRVLGGLVDLAAFATRGFAWMTAEADLRTLETPPTPALLRMPAPPRYAVLAVSLALVLALSFLVMTAVGS